MNYCILLGTAQDAGVPQVGCDCRTCVAARKNPRLRRFAASLGIVLEKERKIFVIDATPDFTAQADALRSRIRGRISRNPVDGIFLTHLHIGHFLGLAFLGREVCHADALPVYASAANLKFLKSNKPFSHLIKRGEIRPVAIRGEIKIGDDVAVRAFPVSHRNEDGDTCGFVISGGKRRIAYLPDLDGWDEPSIAMVKSADAAIVDGTFKMRSEIPRRRACAVAHPTIGETERIFAGCGTNIIFTHFNHTNPLAAKPEKKYQIFEI
jgi:pyrroloquinoline quinone biosynthesis protein B